MKIRMLTAMVLGAALLAGSASLASATSALPGAPRAVPVSSELQAYFSAHGVDQALPQMVEDYMKSYIGALGNNLVLTLGPNEWEFQMGVVTPPTLVKIK